MEDTCCYEWQRCFNTDGYPRAVIDGNANAKVHRVVWELAHQKSAKGLVVRHTCDNPKCINAEHLLLGTPTENMMDRSLRGRHGAAKVTHEEVKEIRQLREAGLPVKAIADAYGLNTRTVYSMTTGKHFKYLT